MLFKIEMNKHSVIFLTTVLVVGLLVAGCFQKPPRPIDPSLLETEEQRNTKIRVAKFKRALNFYQQKNYPAALKIFQELAHAKHAESEYYMGHIRETTGWLFESQENISVGQWYERSARGGDARAQYRLGYFYQHGLHRLPVNLEVAIYLYQRAAEQNNLDAKNALGELYYDGQGLLEQDYQLAFVLLQPAAEQDYTQAQYYLATMYDRGWGTTQDYALAKEWYTVVAEKRQAAAHYYLGLLHAKGRGVEQNDILAYMHFKLAEILLKDQLRITSSQIYEQQDDLEQTMPLTQILIAQEKTVGWLADHPE